MDVAALQKALAGAYGILQELGGGGMSRVFLAEDRALGRTVVIKVLAPELAAGVSADRFAREVRTLAALQHPHIVPVLSAGMVEGLPYYVMPFVRGRSVRARLADGPLTITEATSILRDVARALDYAHREGVVHRDIKPDNVLIADDVAVVSDFGVAKAVSAAAISKDGAEPLTRLGIAIGTPGYMAPEQAAADPCADHRVDIYAWAIMAYELLVGEHPFVGRAPAALFAAHMIEIPPEISSRRDDVPEFLSSLVARCLSKDPDQRPASAALLTQELSGVSSAGVNAVTRATATPSERPSIAVLPFGNLSADPDHAYFADGITEEIITALGALRSLRVAARTSAFAVKGEGGDLRAMAKRLGVAYVLEGSVRRSGSRVRVSVQLVDARNGFQLWSDQLDRDQTDVFALQDEIAARIQGALSAVLVAGQPPAVRQPPLPLRADLNDRYLLGRHMVYQFVAEQARRGLDVLEGVVSTEPSFVPAHAVLADAYLYAGFTGVLPPPIAYANARRAAENAMRLDDSRSEAHATLGYLALFSEYDYPRAERLLDRAIALNPSNSIALMYHSHCMSSLGRFEESIQSARHALAIDPLSPVIGSNLALMFLNARRYEEGLVQARAVLEFSPHDLHAHWYAGFFEMLLGRPTEGRRLMRNALAISRDAMTLGLMGNGLARCGDPEGARRLLAEMLAPDRVATTKPDLVALIYAGLGEVDNACDWLDRAAAAKVAFPLMVSVGELYDSLRGSPRFAAVLKAMGLENVKPAPESPSRLASLQAT
jgi:TolB-like protein/tetratricopeptide (TPR) repeat protein